MRECKENPIGETKHSTPKIIVIYGTRPEAIKLAPVIKELKTQTALETKVLTTGQHTDMVTQVNSVFGITPDIELQVFKPGQNLNSITSRVLQALDPVLEEMRPNAVLVQGDTTTVMGAALAAFHLGIKVIHIEAGLRSGNINLPFPEEANRKIVSQIATLHLAPTLGACKNLEAENVSRQNISITGNTVIDALQWVVNNYRHELEPDLETKLKSYERHVLVTVHRRESWGSGINKIAKAIANLAAKFSGVQFILPLHANPAVAELFRTRLEGISNILIVPPQGYAQFVKLMELVEFIVTDSGGIQEEGPSLGKPVLVLRDTTERPEAIIAGTAKIIGTDTEKIISEVSLLLEDPHAYSQMATVQNPYGDGNASKRVVCAIKALFGVGKPELEFLPSDPIDRKHQ